MKAFSLPDNHTLVGVCLIISGLFLFSIQDVIIKSFSGTYPVLQLVFIRSITGLIILLAIVLALQKPETLKLHRRWPILSKGALAYLSYVFYYLAIAALPLAEAATITFMAPLIVTAMSAVIFKEKVGIHRWSAVCLGFFSIVLVVGPQGHFNNPAVVLALLAAVTYAASTLLTRYIDPRDSATTSAFYTTLVYLILSIVSNIIIYSLSFAPENTDPSLQFLTRDWVIPPEQDQWLMILIGLISCIGFYCLVRAYMVAEFSSIAPFEYTYIFWGVVFGYLIWNELPGMQSIFGIVLLIASNLYILYREVTLKQRVAFRRPRIPKR